MNTCSTTRYRENFRRDHFLVLGLLSLKINPISKFVDYHSQPDFRTFTCTWAKLINGRLFFILRKKFVQLIFSGQIIVRKAGSERNNNHKQLSFKRINADQESTQEV